MGSYSWNKREGELDLPVQKVNETVLAVLLEQGATKWLAKFTVVQEASKLLGGENYGFGAKFEGQVGRALNKFADDPRFVKVGKGDQHYTIEGDTRSAYGSEPLWTTVEYQAACKDAYEKSEAGREAIIERCSRIVVKTTLAGYYAETKIYAERSGYDKPMADPAGRWHATVKFSLEDVEAITHDWSEV